MNIHNRITAAAITLRGEPDPKLREIAGSMFIVSMLRDMPDFNVELFRQHAGMLPTSSQQATRFAF